jgi:3-ketosteroid 9alpha-monooxygenase subunit A
MYRTYRHGWYLVGFERDLNDEIAPVSVGSERLLLVCAVGAIRAFNADCPHRGAHLGYGGQLDDNAIICPFHRFRIVLGTRDTNELSVRERHALVVGGLVFIRLSDGFDHGFTDFIQDIAESHVIMPGHVWYLEVPAALMIENGFDPAHFQSVHRFGAHAIRTQTNLRGDLEMAGCLGLAAKLERGDVTFSEDQSTTDRVGTPKSGIPFALSAFSPGLSVLRVGGEYPYVTIIGATPGPKKHSLLRVSLALPRAVYGDPPDQQIASRFLEQIKAGIEDDRAIWEHLSFSSPAKFMATDAPVVEFRRFCRQLEAPAN